MSRFTAAAATPLRALTRQPYRFGAAITSRPFSQSMRYRAPKQPSHLLPEYSLKDKVVIVSGGARGLGLVQAEACLEAGAKVHIIDILPNPSNDTSSEFSTLLSRLPPGSSPPQYHQSDVRQVPELNSIIKSIADQEGRLDGLIAAAGINYEAPALEYSSEEVDRMLGINVKGVFVTAQAVAREMVRLGGKGGSIVMIGSMSAGVANRGMVAPLYNPSKAAVVQLAKNLAMEWAPHNIRVNTISPGYIVTAMTESLFQKFPERRKEWASHNMMNRLSEPKEFRGAAVFLLSEASSFMTGGDLRIDGGHTAW